jgi:hypothetical protein
MASPVGATIRVIETAILPPFAWRTTVDENNEQYADGYADGRADGYNRAHDVATARAVSRQANGDTIDANDLDATAS